MTSTIISRLEALEAQSTNLAALIARIDQLEAEVKTLREVLGTSEPNGKVKVVGMTVSSDGKRHLSDQAKANISKALKEKAAARKAAKLAESEQVKSE